MTWVKICGITNLEDAVTAVEAGADALGFVFYDKSPRNINPEEVGEIVAKVPARVEKVGVFVNETAERIDESVRQAGLTGVQLCGKESVAGFIKRLRVQRDINHHPKVIFVIPGGALSEGLFFIGDELKNALHALLIDSGSAAQPGGTGKRFDWEKARGMVEMLGLTIPTIVAGGLTPTNVGEALNLLHPWGIDVASGVEAKPGKKDPAKVRAFVAAVRQTERLV
ncbi:MAG TPA: phosphoribosylanthranilate isomerase [Terriglobales bacterium]|jgi:phosphoribosylanthranilate isomerase|nr:phosphoribosylanthranilate isomerase [Terriglobales bacterium]